MRKKHLQILGLSEDASEGDIKRSFRKLAFLYHPDRNTSPDANSKFLELCEAYQALIENNYSNELIDTENRETVKKYNKDLSPEEFEKRIKWAREYAERKAFEEEHIHQIALAQMKTSMMKYLIPLSIFICTTLSLLISLDYIFLSPVLKEGVLMGYGEYGLQVEYDIYDVEGSAEHRKNNPNETNHDVFVKIVSRKDEENWHAVPKNVTVFIVESPIFRDIIGFKQRNRVGFEQEEENLSIVYNRNRLHFLFWLYFPILLSPIIVRFFKGANSFYIVFVYLTTYLGLVTSSIYLILLSFYLF